MVRLVKKELSRTSKEAVTIKLLNFSVGALYGSSVLHMLTASVHCKVVKAFVDSSLNLNSSVIEKLIWSTCLDGVRKTTDKIQLRYSESGAFGIKVRSDTDDPSPSISVHFVK
jgi:hypothetical protein